MACVASTPTAQSGRRSSSGSNEEHRSRSSSSTSRPATTSPLPTHCFAAERPRSSSRIRTAAFVSPSGSANRTAVGSSRTSTTPSRRETERSSTREARDGTGPGCNRVLRRTQGLGRPGRSRSRRAGLHRGRQEAAAQETGDNEYNRAIHSAVLRAGVDVITDLNPEIFHQKFMVRDPALPTAAVLTGSTNCTLTDTGKNTPGASAVSGNNLNHVVVLHSERAADQYLAEFQRYRSGTFGELHERHEPRPAEFRLAKIRVKPLFAPMHAPEMELMKQMLKARSSIDFAMFTFAESSGIDDTMIRLVGSLPRVRGVLDRAQGAQAWAATQPLKAAGVQLFQNKTGTGVRKIHHKLMVVDERLVIAGSFNYTAPGRRSTT